VSISSPHAVRRKNTGSDHTREWTSTYLDSQAERDRVPMGSRTFSPVLLTLVVLVPAWGF
jgi:hypothetical protein